MRHAIAAILLLVACGTSQPIAPATPSGVVAIVGGLVKPMNGPDIPGGTVILKEGLILEVGKDVAIPAGASVVDAKGKIVMPGFVDSNTRVGILEV